MDHFSFLVPAVLNALLNELCYYSQGFATLVIKGEEILGQSAWQLVCALLDELRERLLHQGDSLKVTALHLPEQSAMYMIMPMQSITCIFNYMLVSASVHVLGNEHTQHVTFIWVFQLVTAS